MVNFLLCVHDYNQSTRIKLCKGSLSNRTSQLPHNAELTYVSLSVLLHARTWFVPDNPDMLAVFPGWYSLVFLGLAGALIAAWSRLRSKT